MNTDQSFEEYLVSKKIDSVAFKMAEPNMWHTWKIEFEQVHSNSFTVQKLNLINPVRRKYLLKSSPEIKSSDATAVPQVNPVSAAKPGKPVIKPRPKIGP